MDRTIQIDDFPAISIFTEDEGIRTELERTEIQKGLYVYRFRFSADTPISPKPVTLRWRIPAVNVKGVWKSGTLHDKRLQYDWELMHIKTRISVDAPVLCIFGHDDTNVASLACADAINLIEMNSLLREEDNHLYFHLTFFSERHPEILSYETAFRVDLRNHPFFEALQETANWWEEFEYLKPTPVPPLARAPLYSTWYSVHQDLDPQQIIAECKIAAQLGYEFIILDDGWQTKDSNRGYDFTGDWQPERLTDLAGLVAQIHQLGMKVGLWFSVPFCGNKSKAYQRFQGKFLTENHRWAPVFDPRYPEVRAHLIDIYAHALETYRLDAFKLDFIDDFQVYPETELSLANGRDYANVNEAVDRLMTDVHKRLTAIKPDVAIEFRQKYVGPAMRKFGHMFRAFDCPNDPVSNRIRITDVKLLSGDSIVHSDPITWHQEESVELAALQLINGIFGVPQMSVMLQEMPQTHLDMIAFYTEYWKTHADILLDGKFKVKDPLANYPVISTQQRGHQIIGIFGEVIIPLEANEKIDLLNGSMNASIVLRLEQARDFEMTVWNCQGEKEICNLISLPAGLSELAVKPAGMICLISKK